MSIEITKESSREEEKPLAAVTDNGKVLLLPHTDPKRHYVWDPGGCPYIVDGSIEHLVKYDGAKPIYSGGEIKVVLFKFHRN